MGFGLSALTGESTAPVAFKDFWPALGLTFEERRGIDAALAEAATTGLEEPALSATHQPSPQAASWSAVVRPC